MNQPAQNSDFGFALRKILVMMMLRDDKIKLEEIYEIKSVIKQLTGKEATDIEVQEVVDAVSDTDESIEDYLTTTAIQLDKNEKTMLLRAAILLSSSDGEIHDEEMTLLHQFTESFGFSNSELKALIEKTIHPN